MNKEEIKAKLMLDAGRFKEAGATGVFMFGSRARGDNKADSDLDLFIDYSEGKKVPSFFDLLEIQLRIENRLGIAVHLGTRASLDPAFRKVVEQEAIRVF
jgi:uncharacterized protein